MPITQIIRNAKNKIGKYTSAQIKARDATSNEPEGPSLNLLIEIAANSFNPIILDEMLQILTKRLNDDSRNWRHIYKAIKVFEFLCIHGSNYAEDFVRRNIHYFESLKSYQQYKDNRECGAIIRDSANDLLNLINNSANLQRARNEAKNIAQAVARKKMSQKSFDSPEYRSLDNVDTASSRQSRHQDVHDIKNAYPASAEEEDAQIQIALALSKEQSIDTISQNMSEPIPKQKNAQSLDDMLLIDFSTFGLDNSKSTKVELKPNLKRQDTADFDIFDQELAVKPKKPEYILEEKSDLDDILGLSSMSNENIPKNKNFDISGFSTFQQPTFQQANFQANAQPNYQSNINFDNLEINNKKEPVKKTQKVDDPFGFLDDVINSTITGTGTPNLSPKKHEEEKQNYQSSNNPFL